MSQAHEPAPYAQKFKTLQELQELAQGWRRQGKTIVWTNGCFDILHAGHIEFLMKAARLGDVFIAGVNSDASIAQLEGDQPYTPEEERVLVLSAVACIDYVTVFNETTCTHILQALRPDVYAKGLRHLHGGINEDERHVIENLGGCIALIASDPNKSTAKLIEKIRA